MAPESNLRCSKVVWLGLAGLVATLVGITALAQSVDAGFDPSINWASSDCCVKRILHAPGGGYYVASNSGLRRVLSNGAIDATFVTVNTSGRIDDAVVQPTGKVVIVGDFDTVDSVVRPGVARINADGTLDTGFNPGIQDASFVYEARVFALASGKLLLSAGGTGGFDVALNDQRELLLLSADGSIDNGLQLDAQLTNQGEAAPLADGRILWFGDKWDDPQHNDASDWAGTLNGNGGIAQQLDDLLNVNLDLGGGLTVMPNGSILVLGYVPDALPPTTYNYFGKLTPALGIDFSFQPNQLRNYVSSGAHFADSLPDGSTLFIGHYHWNGQPSNQASDRLGRVSANGTRDMAWVEPIFNNSITAMLLQADGSVVVGGEFTAIDGTPRLGLARILPEAPYDPIFHGDFE